MKTILSTSTLLMLLVFGWGGNTWAGETLHMMKVASNPCAAKHTNPCNPCNPCAKKATNPCNPCANKAANPCNPCAKKAANPCNPCGKKAANPCNPGSSSYAKADRIDPKLVSRPAGVKLYSGMSRAALVKEGGGLFKARSLSSNSLACQDCHETMALFNKGFEKPYPHKVSMAKQRAGLSRNLYADEFVQFCMMAPMAADPLPWEGKKLAALAAYVVDVKQKEYSSWLSANPCAAKNAAANPCAAKHANPCNPCAKKAANPCNPCAK